MGLHREVTCGQVVHEAVSGAALDSGELLLSSSGCCKGGVLCRKMSRIGCKWGCECIFCLPHFSRSQINTWSLLPEMWFVEHFQWRGRGEGARRGRGLARLGLDCTVCMAFVQVLYVHVLLQARPLFWGALHSCVFVKRFSQLSQSAFPL